MTFKVQKRMCATCVYRPDTPLDLAALEAQVRDPHMGFKGHRICHHSTDVCCRGFWEAHKDEFALGQIAQRLDMVEFVEVDKMSIHDDRCATRKGYPCNCASAAFKRSARYNIVSVTDDVILIEDLDGPVSVTNDAEAVVENLIAWKGKFTEQGKPFRIHYIDTMSNRDELVHKNGVFTGFAPVDKIRKV